MSWKIHPGSMGKAHGKKLGKLLREILEKGKKSRDTVTGTKR
jgi:hypothetical protein